MSLNHMYGVQVHFIIFFFTNNLFYLYKKILHSYIGILPV